VRINSLQWGQPILASPRSISPTRPNHLSTRTRPGKARLRNTALFQTLSKLWPDFHKKLDCLTRNLSCQVRSTRMNLNDANLIAALRTAQNALGRGSIDYEPIWDLLDEHQSLWDDVPYQRFVDTARDRFSPECVALLLTVVGQAIRDTTSARRPSNGCFATTMSSLSKSACALDATGEFCFYRRASTTACNARALVLTARSPVLQKSNGPRCVRSVN
jgi:hypothetical protein